MFVKKKTKNQKPNKRPEMWFNFAQLVRCFISFNSNILHIITDFVCEVHFWLRRFRYWSLHIDEFVCDHYCCVQFQMYKSVPSRLRAASIARINIASNIFRKSSFWFQIYLLCQQFSIDWITWSTWIQHQCSRELTITSKKNCLEIKNKKYWISLNCFQITFYCWSNTYIRIWMFIQKLRSWLNRDCFVLTAMNHWPVCDIRRQLNALSLVSFVHNPFLFFSIREPISNYLPQNR